MCKQNWDDGLPNGGYQIPPRTRCEKYPISDIVPCGIEYLRIQGNRWTQAGRLTEFVFVLQVRNENTGRWQTHLSIDCTHSNAHIHYYKDGERDGHPRETIKVLNRARDVQDALGMAILRIRQEINKLVEV